MPEEGPVGVLWEGGSCSGGVGPIPSSKDGMGDSSPNNCGVGGRMSDLGQGGWVHGRMVGLGDGCGVGKGMVGLGAGCGVGEGMVGLKDGGGVGGEGSGVETTRGVATGRRPVGAVLMLGLSVVLGL